MIKLRESMERWIRVDFRAKKRKEEKRREKGIEEGKLFVIYIYWHREQIFFFRPSGNNRMDRRFCARIFRTRRGEKKGREKEGKAFRGKQNFIVERSIFQGKWGWKKSFLDRVEATASMQ